MRRILLFFTATAVLSFLCVCLAAEGPQNPEGALKAAIFVQDRTQGAFTANLDTFKELITARLSQKGLVIIDKNDCLAKFKEARSQDPQTSDAIKILTDLIKAAKTEHPVEDAVSDASALRISSLLGADYMIFASIVSFGHESKTFKGEGTVYGTDAKVTDYIMRLSVKVLDAARAGTIYADVVTVSERMAALENLEVESSDVINKLLDSGSVKLADNVASKIEEIRKAKIAVPAAVSFTVKCNVNQATVELDGVAIGTAPGTFKAPGGLHQLRISKERYATWEKTVNIYAGQVLNVNMELSSEGLDRAKEQKEMDSLLYRVTKDKKEEGK